MDLYGKMYFGRDFCPPTVIRDDVVDILLVRGLFLALWNLTIRLFVQRQEEQRTAGNHTPQMGLPLPSAGGVATNQYGCRKTPAHLWSRQECPRLTSAQVAHVRITSCLGSATNTDSASKKRRVGVTVCRGRHLNVFLDTGCRPKLRPRFVAAATAAAAAI